jgi:hypothetical protein
MNLKISLLKTIAALFCILLFAPGGALAQDAEKDVAKPINCATAEGDIRTLKSEKAHVAEQMAKGVMAIAPAGMVLGVVTGTEKDNLSVASGDYNKMIDDKIAAIKKQCNID